MSHRTYAPRLLHALSHALAHRVPHPRSLRKNGRLVSADSEAPTIWKWRTMEQANRLRKPGLPQRPQPHQIKVVQNGKRRGSSAGGASPRSCLVESLCLAPLPPPWAETTRTLRAQRKPSPPQMRSQPRQLSRIALRSKQMSLRARPTPTYRATPRLLRQRLLVPARQRQRLQLRRPVPQRPVPQRPVPQRPHRPRCHQPSRCSLRAVAPM